MKARRVARCTSDDKDAPFAKQSQFGGPGTDDCGLGIVECGLENHAKQTQFAPGPAGIRGPRGGLCETKPNLGGMGYLGEGTSRAGWFGDAAESAKQSQFGGRGPGNAECGMRGRGRGSGTKRWRRSAEGGWMSLRNKANCQGRGPGQQVGGERGRSPYFAKQSQFAGDQPPGQGSHTADRETKPISTIQQSQAEGQACETKPMCRGAE